MSATFWVISDGGEAGVGDVVALDPVSLGLDRDSVGVIVGVTDRGCPLVEVVTGSRAGARLGVWPWQVLLRVRKGV
ncbi:hypothetical protein [Catellatospora sp. NPDC049609]|uniref:hypothetical protein n=1 Tax=Catellatospora sp. NPDC049609 TaxID=3155505 RepID=UPI003427DCAB